MAKLSIVIVNYNVKHYISQCLDSVFNSSLKDVEVIVVDNHSRDGSVEHIKSKYPEVKVIASNHNLGFARGNNLALRSIKSQYALLLNPDTILTTDVLQRSVDFMDANPKCGGLGVCMLNVDGTKAMESRRGLPTPLTSFYKMIGLCKRFPKHKSFGRYYLGCLPWDKPASIEVISGAYCMLRKEALDKVGYLTKISLCMAKISTLAIVCSRVVTRTGIFLPLCFIIKARVLRNRRLDMCMCSMRLCLSSSANTMDICR